MLNNPKLIVALTALWGVTIAVTAVIVFMLTVGRDVEPIDGGIARPTVPSTPISDRLTPVRIQAMGLNELPDVSMPADNPMTNEKVELGRLLFFDRRMSGDGLVSCATCHAPNKGWGDGNALSLGYPGNLHWRNSQTIINSAYLQKLFWAGESTSLERQAKSAFTGNLAGNLDSSMAEEQLRQIPDYVRRFNEVFGTDTPSFDDMLRAVAAFEATITSRNVPFDNYMQGDNSALSDQQLRGLELFTGKAGCLQCHTGPLFTDENFHNIGVPPHPDFESDPLRQIAFRYQHMSRGVPEEVYRTADRDYGLYYTTKEESDRGRFRTAPLRELSQTAPYMHNGVFDTLDEVVRFYNAGGGDDANKSNIIQPLGLGEGEIADLVAFLDGLTGDEIIIAPPDMPDYAVLP